MLLPKYTFFSIRGIPKRFKVTDVVDTAFPEGDWRNPENILYDQFPVEPYLGDSEVMAYKYRASATGVYVTLFRSESLLIFRLSFWASDADVELCATLINTMLRKHRRACLYKGQQQLPCLTDEDVRRMQAERRKYLKRLLVKREPFDMEGFHRDVSVASITPMSAPRLAENVSMLRQRLVDEQWVNRDD